MILCEKQSREIECLSFIATANKTIVISRWAADTHHRIRKKRFGTEELFQIPFTMLNFLSIYTAMG